MSMLSTPRVVPDGLIFPFDMAFYHLKQNPGYKKALDNNEKYISTISNAKSDN